MIKVILKITVINNDDNIKDEIINKINKIKNRSLIRTRQNNEY